ncbi:MAG: hypothetical protein AAFR49_19925, partial [Pseudomonadota bacterium]
MDSANGIFGQRYAADGTATGAEFHVNTATDDIQDYPNIVALDDGGFLAIWGTGVANDPTDPDNGFYLQRYDAVGATVGGEVRLETPGSANVDYSSQNLKAIELDGGGFAMLWRDQDTFEFSVQKFDDAGQ